jgi:hypothetical protein
MVPGSFFCLHFSHGTLLKEKLFPFSLPFRALLPSDVFFSPFFSALSSPFFDFFKPVARSSFSKRPTFLSDLCLAI